MVGTQRTPLGRAITDNDAGCPWKAFFGRKRKPTLEPASTAAPAEVARKSPKKAATRTGRACTGTSMGEFRFRPCRHDGSWAVTRAPASPVRVIFLVTTNTPNRGSPRGERGHRRGGRSGRLSEHDDRACGAHLVGYHRPQIPTRHRHRSR